MSEIDARNQLIRAAEAARQRGRLEDAAMHYNALLARWPNLPDSWYNLGLVQRHLGRFDAALESYGQALARGAAQPEEIHLNRGAIFADHLRNDAAAEAELHAALGLNPAYTPALQNLANLREDQGRREDALALYERLLAIAPDHAEGLARYATLKTASSRDDPLVGRLKGAIANANTSLAEKASLSFALGKLLDGCADYDDAFHAYAAANRISRASVPGAPRYDRARQTRLVDELISTFQRQEKSDHGDGAPPVFICGMFRSGSTLAEQILASHPRVTAGGELDILPSLIRTQITPFPSGAARLDAMRWAHLRERYLQSIAKLFPAADVVTDKRPDNFLNVGLIKRLFPSAKIIHTRRDPLDNCLSIYFLHLDQSMAYALDLMDTAHYLREHDRLMAHWKALFPGEIFEFDYDAFVSDPRPVVEKMLAFCGLDWNDNCLAFHRTKSAVKTASVWQVREPLYARSSGRWRHYSRHLEEVRAFLAGG